MRDAYEEVHVAYDPLREWNDRMATKIHHIETKCPAPQPEPYYDKGGIRTLDVISSKLTPTQYEGFLLGNIIKYSLRMNYKGCAAKDAEKLAEYSLWLSELKKVVK